MKYVDEYRDRKAVKQLQKSISAATSGAWNIMEVCGGQTHAIMKFGINELLPESITLIHGPGCPVCVTPIELIDKAIQLALRQDVILCSFGDMLRVPGSKRSLFDAKAEGADVRIVYSPLDSLRVTSEHPEKEVVFFAVGFETTAPTTAMTVLQAAEKGIANFSVLTSHVLVPPALEALLSSPQNKVDAFLAAGHVCTIMGYHQYEPISANYKVPIVVTGFEPVDILEGVLLCVQQLEQGRAEVENQYARAVQQNGNVRAQQILKEVFTVSDRPWRGIGTIPSSGLVLREPYHSFDAIRRFEFAGQAALEATDCRGGEVLRGVIKPNECAAFGTLCTPKNPLGAPMVSSEGACAAYYRYRTN